MPEAEQADVQELLPERTFHGPQGLRPRPEEPTEERPPRVARHASGKPEVYSSSEHRLRTLEGAREPELRYPPSQRAGLSRAAATGAAAEDRAAPDAATGDGDAAGRFYLPVSGPGSAGVADSGGHAGAAAATGGDLRGGTPEPGRYKERYDGGPVAERGSPATPGE